MSESMNLRKPLASWQPRLMAHWSTAAAVILLLIGFAVRLVNLRNPPLDFHAWRQLRSATIARSLYYQFAPDVDPELRSKAMELDQDFEVLEPNILEAFTAAGYLLVGGESLWIARLLVILFWGIGGVAVYRLASELTTPSAALFSLAFYMLLPYGVIASRSFQPDPIMVMWLVWGCYALYRWTMTRTWRWCVAAGVLSGLAILVKVFAAFPIILVAVFLVTGSHKSLARILRDRQTWLAAVLMAAIPAVYYLFLIGNLASGYISGWVLAFSELLVQPWFYVRWLEKVHGLMDLSWVLVGLVSIFLVSGMQRRMLAGLWLGYALIGLTVPSLIISHDYYNLALIPILAISISPAAARLIAAISQRPSWEKAAVLVLLAVAVAFPAWSARTELLRVDYRGEVVGWQKLAESLPEDASYIGLTHDYNMRLCYYGWIKVISWPHAADLAMNVLAGGNNDPDSPVWRNLFQERTQNFDYFIITLFSELDEQPALAKILSEYPAIEGQGYILYDLSGKP